jgi:antitoxin ParD1/3/4
MTTLTVSLADDTVRFIEEQVRAGGHASVGAYLDAILAEARLREAKRAFEAKIQEAIDSGPAEPLTPEDWDSIRREVRRRHAERQGRTHGPTATGGR